MKAKLILNRDFEVGAVDPRLYGSFIEHMGRAVYHGIYEPTHPLADDMGFRTDVMELVSRLNIGMIRYPGGNFVSGYNWEDGVGPKEKRPRTVDAAWQSIEPNEVGTDEFAEWSRRVGSEMMLAVNLGTRGPEEAKDLLEYCNFPEGSKFADMRCANGHKEPYGARVWCLGNEMDGEWQVGVRKPADYADIVRKTALLMRRTDPKLELVACGSLGLFMKTYGEWETAVLEAAYEQIDYISLHSYFANEDGDTASYLACTNYMDEFIRTQAAACDYVKGKKRSSKTIHLSYDEWNVWSASHKIPYGPDWTVGPVREEYLYNMEDALAFGCMMITLLKHCDRVKMACQAQLVNVAAPIMTENNGRAWAQSIYYPFLHASRYGRGRALRSVLDCAGYHSARFGDVPFVETVGVADDDKGELTVFAVNRSPDEAVELEIDLQGYEGYRPAEHLVLEHPDLQAYNTADDPNEVVPHRHGVTRVREGRTVAVLNRHSWNVIRFRT